MSKISDSIPNLRRKLKGAGTTVRSRLPGKVAKQRAAHCRSRAKRETREEKPAFFSADGAACSSKSVKHNTPEFLVQAILGALRLKAFDLDPCAPSDGGGHVLAHRKYVEADAGLGRGVIGGDRSSLAFYVVKLLRAAARRGAAPAVVVFENVPGLLSDGAAFAVLVQALQGCGYRAGAVVVEAARWLPASRARRVPGRRPPRSRHPGILHGRRAAARMVPSGAAARPRPPAAQGAAGLGLVGVAADGRRRPPAGRHPGSRCGGSALAGRRTGRPVPAAAAARAPARARGRDGGAGGASTA